MEPASSIIRRFGGNAKVAEITGSHRTRVWKWTQPKEVGGSGGRIPQAHHFVLLARAKDLGLDLKAEDFLVQPSAAPSAPQGAAA